MNLDRLDKKIRILHVSTSDIGHGAGIAAYRLHDALNRNGYHSKMLVAEKLSNDESVRSLSNPNDNLFKKFLSKIDHGFEYFVNHIGPQNIYSVLSRKLLDHPWFLNADIIHLNNLHWHLRNFSPSIIPEISKSKKIIWTLHDMWAFTGHCIYSYDCMLWRQRCGHCPNLDSYIRLMWDTTRYLCRLKEKIYSKANFCVVTPSKWLGNMASESPLLKGCDFKRIPYSVDQKFFYPRQSANLLEHTDIKNDWNGKTLLFLSSYLRDERKGYLYFESAVSRLLELKPEISIRVIAVGKGAVSKKLKKICNVIQTGPISDRNTLAQIYSIADVFVMPSIQDNLPNTVLESLACGTPVVCFNVGGLPDMVVHNECGYIANFKDHIDLADGLLEILTDNKKLLRMSQAALHRINSNFSENLQVERHLKLYHTVYNDHE